MKFDQAAIDHLRHLAGENLTAAEIAARMGSTPGLIHTVCARYHIVLGDNNVAVVNLPGPVMERIRSEGERRSYSPGRLLRRIAIIADNLFDAMLDELPPRPSQMVTPE
jgi:hypothetical protein